MFHTYITTTSGIRVDIDRASFLMNSELFLKAMKDCAKEVHPLAISSSGEPFLKSRDELAAVEKKPYAQRVWRRYCDLHLERYKEPFIVDVSDSWDQ